MAKYPTQGRDHWRTPKRSNKKSKSNKWVQAQKRSTTTLVPRSLYPPMPAQLRVSLKACTVNTYESVAGEYAFNVTSCISCFQIGGTAPGGFQSLMRLYSRAVIDRVQSKLSISPYMVDAQPQPYDYGLVNLVSTVLPYQDAVDFPNTLVAYNQTVSRPNSKTKMLGHPYGESAQTFFWGVDVRRALAEGPVETLQHFSNIAGTVIFPVQANVPSAPVILVGYYNSGDNHKFLSITRETTYHMTFSMLHSASNVIAV